MKQNSTVLDTTRDYFSLFHLEPCVELDVALLTQRYRDIQTEIHPDRFAGKSAHEQRLAMQCATFVNEAFTCLKNPLQRAQYLLKLKGFPADAHTTLDHGFLMEQMELREELDQQSRQRDIKAADALMQRIGGLIKTMQSKFRQEFDAGHYVEAQAVVLKWQFLVKLQHDAEQLEDSL